MSRIYTAQFTDVAVTAIQDLFEIVAPADSIVAIHDVHFSQRSDVGDAAEEILNIQLTSGHTTSGSGGSAVTPVPAELQDSAFGGTCEANNTTQALSGTIVTHYSWNWNIRVGFDKVWTPETRPIIAPSRRACFELPVAPADAITMSGSITFSEIG
jgi:hypothetical protein